MKNQVHKFNQFLLECYPTVWNTRILWMLIVALIIHVCFFFFGFATLVNPQSLTKYKVINSYFENGLIGLGLVISLILLVIWLVTLFRNNAFKNFYPTSAWDLFKQFCAYMIIVLVSTSFYYSYTLGLQAYIKINYPQERLIKEHRTVNDSYMFLSENVYKYTLDERILPKQLDTLYCERREFYVDSLQPYYKFKDNYYQYYTIKKVKIPRKDYDLYDSGNSVNGNYNSSNINIKEAVNSTQIAGKQQVTYLDSLNALSLRKEVKKDSVTFFFKGKVAIIDSLIENAVPSYYNFSELFYQKERDYDYYDSYNDYYDASIDDDYNYSPAIKEQINQAQRNHALLNRNNPKEIKTLLKEQIALMNTYGINHNLTVDKWFKLIYHPKNFPLKGTIADSEAATYGNDFIAEDATELEKFAIALQTINYAEIADLRRVYDNLDEAYEHNVFKESIHLFLWISFFIAALIFIFRTTGLRELLFTLVTAGVLGIIVGLLGVVISYGTGSYSGSEYVFSYVALIIGFTIFTIALTSFRYLRKIVSAIFLNLTFVYFLPWLFLILGIISMHQHDACDYTYNYPETAKECITILESIGLWWSYIFIALGLLLVYLFSFIIIKWRSLPEK